jgi:hypothetical protein
LRFYQLDLAYIPITTWTIFNRSILSWPHWNFDIWSSIIVDCTIVGEKILLFLKTWKTFLHLTLNSMTHLAKLSKFKRLQQSFVCYAKDFFQLQSTSMRHRLGWQLSYQCISVEIIRWCQRLTFELTWFIDIDINHYTSSAMWQSIVWASIRVAFNTYKDHIRQNLLFHGN